MVAVPGLREETLTSSLDEMLGLEDIEEDDVYPATDRLLPRQQKTEKALATRDLGGHTLVLYDHTSTRWGARCSTGHS